MSKKVDIPSTYFLEIRDLIDKNELGTISYSKLSIIKQCPFVYNAIYVKHYKKKDLESYTKTNVGKFIHAFLERLTPRVAQEYPNIEGNIDVDLIWGSLLKESRFQLTQVELDEAEAIREDAINMGIYIGSNYSNKTHKIHTESFIGINRNLNSFAKQQNYLDLLITGYIDVLATPTTPENEALLLDYKTFPKTKDSFASIKPQLELYALLLFYKYSDLQKINTMVGYVPENMYDSAVYTRSDLPMLENNFKELILTCIDILRYHKKEKIKGPHCVWCGYKYICD